MTRTSKNMRAIPIVAALLCACGPLPQDGPQRGLYVDLRTQVENQEQTDWLPDQHQVEKMAGRALRSACQVRPGDRTALLEWLDARIIAEGGPPEAAWERAGRDLDAIDDLMTLHRVRILLEHIDEQTDDCPFWLEVDEDFAGIETDTGRLVITAESLGALQLFFGGDTEFAGGSGGGRLLFGGGLTDRFSLSAGAEAGVSSTFPKDDEGRRSVKAAVTAATPLILRVKDGTWRYDTEAALTGRIADQDLDQLEMGMRVGQTIGLVAPRIAGLMPFAGIWISHEWLPGLDLHILRVGSRVGVELDP